MDSSFPHRGIAALAVLSLFVAASAAPAQVVVYEDLQLADSYPVFTSSTPAGTLIADGYWCTPNGSPPITDLVALELRLIGESLTPGSTDINFVFADGDPSGQQIAGTGNVLYETTITDVQLPATPGGLNVIFLTIPLPNLALSGGFNDWGFSIGVENFDYAGTLGLYTSLPPTSIGFSSFLASRYDPVAEVWNNVTNNGELSFAARLVQLPSPGTAAVVVLGLSLGARRRRHYDV